MNITGPAQTPGSQEPREIRIRDDSHMRLMRGVLVAFREAGIKTNEVVENFSVTDITEGPKKGGAQVTIITRCSVDDHLKESISRKIASWGWGTSENVEHLIEVVWAGS